MRNRSSRLTLLAVSLVGVFAAITGSAAAAEVPEIEAGVTANTSINSTKAEALVNPEGAATTYKAEYRPSGSSGAFTSTGTQNVGSGTGWVPMSVSFHLAPESGNYEIRVSATNSFGTIREVVSKKFASAAWSIETGISSSTFVSSGKWKFEWTQLGHPSKIECDDAGNGTIGQPSGTGDGYSMVGKNCVYSVDGKAVCNLTSGLTFSTNLSNFTDNTAINQKWMCPGGETWQVLQVKAPYTVSMPNQAEALKTQAVTLTAPMAMNGFTGDGHVTITTNWALSGANAGRTFSVAGL